MKHTYPQWENQDPDLPPYEGQHYIWSGNMRIVHAQRARKLRKRGVPLLPLHRVHDKSGGVHARGEFEPISQDRARYAWFTE